MHIDLFSGIGGFALAARWAGLETALFCEKDEYCQKVLRKHWPDVPIIDDIRKVNRNHVTERPFLLTGGFPCQPFSNAGKRGGTEDDRYLWPEMLRVITDLSPQWVIGENVVGLLSMDNGAIMEQILADLDGAGYRVEVYAVPACSVGATHRRERL